MLTVKYGVPPEYVAVGRMISGLPSPLTSPITGLMTPEAVAGEGTGNPARVPCALEAHTDCRSATTRSGSPSASRSATATELTRLVLAASAGGMLTLGLNTEPSARRAGKPMISSIPSPSRSTVGGENQSSVELCGQPATGEPAPL